MSYKDNLLKNLYNHAPESRYKIYENLEESMRDVIGHIPKDEMMHADKEILLAEYQEYFLKKYIYVKADLKERFYVAQLVRWVIAKFRTEIK